MHIFLKKYIDAKHATGKHTSCVYCGRNIEKKSQNHVFCKVRCKDFFWGTVRGRQVGRFSIPPQYPGGHDQWKIDLRRTEERIAEQIILEGGIMRYIVFDENGCAVAVFMEEDKAQKYVDYILDTESEEYDLKEISVEDVHEYI